MTIISFLQSQWTYLGQEDYTITILNKLRVQFYLLISLFERDPICADTPSGGFN